jgi:hypothetical protein
MKKTQIGLKTINSLGKSRSPRGVEDLQPENKLSTELDCIQSSSLSGCRFFADEIS